MNSNQIEKRLVIKMKQNPPKNYTGPMYTIKAPKLNSDSTEAENNQTLLIEKTKTFKINSQATYKKDIVSIKKVTNNEKTVKTEFLREVLTREAKYRSLAIKNDNTLKHSNDLTTFNSVSLNEQIFSPKLAELETELQRELNSNKRSSQSDENKLVNDDVADLQGTKGLAKYDCWDEDLKPEDWTLLCSQDESVSHAKCPLFRDNKYVWVDVKVVNYDKDKNRFLVRIEDKDKYFEKYVSRLSIYFLKEDLSKFRSRIAQCKLYQSRAEEEIRFIRMVESISNDLIRSLPTFFVHNIKKKVSLTRKKNNDVVADQTTLSQMMKIIHAEYSREMKQCYILDEMKDPSKQEFFKSKGITLRHESTQRFEYETLMKSSLKEHFGERLNQLKHRVFFRNPKMSEALRMFHEKSHDFQKRCLLDLNVFEKKHPFFLNDFINLQKDHLDRHKESLKILWRDHLLGDIQDVLRNIQSFNSAMNDLNHYKQNSKLSLERFLNRIDISFRYHLSKFFDLNCYYYKSFLNKFILPKEGEEGEWSVSEKPLLKMAIKFVEADKRKRDKDKRLNKEERLIYFEPTFEDFCGKLTEPIRWLASFVGSINCLEADVTRIIGIAYYQLLCIDESRIEAVCEEIKVKLTQGFEEPNRILASFKPYEFLLEKSKEEIIKNYFEDISKMGSFAMVDEYLAKVGQSILEINCLCANEHKSVLFQIRAAELKEQLTQRAIEIKKGILKKMSNEVNKNIESIRTSYQDLQTQMLCKPEKEEDLVALNKIISSCEERLLELGNKTDETYKYITIMEKHGERFDENNMINFWLLKVCPVDVHISQNEGKKLAITQEQNFLAKLDEDKRIFEIDISNYKLHCDELKRLNDYKSLSESAKKSEELGSKLDDAKKRLADFNRKEALFETVPCKYESLDRLIEEFGPYRNLWDTAFFFDSSRENWMMSPITKINHKKIGSELDKHKKSLIQLTKKFEEEGNTSALTVCVDVKEDIKEFEKNMPLIDLLTRECLTKKPVNWKNLFSALHVHSNQHTDTLAQLLNSRLTDQMEKIEDIVLKAEKEYLLEIKLQKEIIDKLKTIKLELLPHKQSGSFMISQVDELLTVLDELLNTLLMIKQSPFLGTLRKKTEEIEKKLIGVQDLLGEWLKCQRTWIYLNPIFASEDLKKKMPVEKRLFDGVDANWQSIMAGVHNDPLIFENFDWEKTKIDFESSNKVLDQVQKSLSDYLEAKRDEFPRFYFLSDEELIEMISKTKDPTLITKYLGKCFEGIDSIEFAEGNEVILSFSSPEKEKIKLKTKINVNEGEKKGNVEKWLSELEDGMRETLKSVCKEAYNELGKVDRALWLKKWPGQVVLAIDSVKWTFGVEEAISQSTLSDFEKQSNAELSYVVDLVRQDLSMLDRLTLSALIVIEVHAKYVVAELIKNNINQISDFSWISQFRYYMSDKGKLKTSVMIADYDYQYEYLGNTPRLVITPLTDRCYRTLMSAYQFFYGGAPEGPAGTGKTETVKDLAKAVAVQCNVFNCTDQINYVAMSKFFKGLSQTGAWCCFDEFNRIETEVLSVIAEQVRTIQTAIKEGKNKFFFEGKNMRLIKSCAINITMNPGYAGRSELPDNLKCLFRACAMMIPDYSLISEISLYSNGFQTADRLATKVVAALRLSSEQLSAQKHYDFGMRALKAILVAAGTLKKKMPDENEASLCLKALKDVNLPKFNLDDIPLFNSIISDLFPEVDQPPQDYSSLIDNIKLGCEDLGIQSAPEFMNKVIQLYDTIQVRHGLMVVGETFSGKSKCSMTLQKAMRRMGKSTERYIINPKAITGLQLYGSLDQNTKIWTDGIIPNIMKICEGDIDKPEYKWVCFDGPVDAVWIENMNTVLDDNKVLCLTNGQKIKLTQWMTMMFEVEDLINASPATVSRTGIVYMEPNQLGWQTILDNYILGLAEPLNPSKETIKFNFDWLLSAVLVFVDKCVKLPLKINSLQLTHNCLTVFTMLLREFDNFSNLEKNVKDLEGKIQDLVLYSVIWGVGGIVDEHYRQETNLFMIKLIYFEDVRKTYGLDIPNKNWSPRNINIQVKDLKNLFNMKLDIEKMTWTEWTTSKFEISRDKTLRFEELIIPTAETQRTGYFLRSILKTELNILLVGPTGTGKTLGVLNEIKENFNNKEIGSICTNFSGQTLVNTVQRQIESKMTTRKGKKGHFGPEDNKKAMVVFIDDVNMPVKETYGAQPPIELLRMMLDHGFWYDLDTIEPKYLKNLSFAVSMGPPSTGRNSVSSRFIRHFFLSYLCPFDNQSMQNIFGSILDYQFATASPKFLPSVIALKDTIVKSTIELFERIKSAKELLPTPQKSHYLFSMRDISRVFLSLSKASFRTFKNEEDMIKLWVHECTRVVMDRLISPDDQIVFQSIIRGVVKSDFKTDLTKLVKSEPLLFADFIPINTIDKEGNSKSITGVYNELSDKNHLKQSFAKILNDYNEFNANNKLNIVLFIEAIEHVVRIVRVVTTPSGHCLLVGLGGLGRKTLTMLAAFIATFEYRSLEMTNSFSNKEWTEALQDTLKEAGMSNKKVVFLLKDYQIFSENMLEDISSLLNRGEIPGLFPNDEKAKIIEEISLQNPNDQLLSSMTNNEKFEFFGKRCRDNLHLSLCFSPAGQDFKKRLRSFPSLINCTTVDWFLDWPHEAFHAVAEVIIKETELNAKDSSKVCNVMVEMQQSTVKLSTRFFNELKRHYYVTPMNFLELNSLFVRILKSRINETETNINRYEKGVKTLEESKIKVEEMKKIIIELEPKLKIANEETEELIATVEKEKTEAGIKKSNCELEELQCNKNREEAQALKAYCQQELDKVEPLLETASKNLKTIQRAHIDFIKTLKILLPPVLKLFQALCILFKVKNIPTIKDPNDPMKKKLDWATPARTIVMAKPDQMLTFMLEQDAEKINKFEPSIIQQLKDLQKDPVFDIGAIENVSQAAGKIALFINTVVEIYDKLQIINPKREALKEAETQLEEAEKSLLNTKQELATVMAKIDALENQLNEAKNKKDNLEKEIQRCKRQLVSAEKLVQGLESEKHSWNKNIEELKKNRQTILSDVLLSCGVIAYLGVFPVSYREWALSQWNAKIENCGLPVCLNFELKSVLSNDIIIADWTNKYKLPNDSYSIDNAVVIFNSNRFPLIIDPQSQANRWIKLKEKENNLVVLRPNMRPNDIQNTLINSIELGYPVLFENVDENLGWSVLAVLENKRKKSGKIPQLKFLDRWVDVHENFKFYVTTKLSKPHFSPDVCVLATMLNFQVTPLGLEDQLLNILVSKEDPNSEKARINNVRDFYDLKKKQKATEDNILYLLTTSETSILDNTVLIDALQKSKNEAKDREARFADIENMKKKLTVTRNFYKIAANRAANLFFCVNDLGILEPMYQFSLDWFIDLYIAAINEEPKVKETRVSDIVKLFVKMLFSRVSPSLFEKDKLLFAFLIYTKLMLCEELVTEDHIRKLFVGCTSTLPKSSNLLSELLTDKQFGQIEELVDSFPSFCEIFDLMRSNLKSFKQLLDDPNPQLFKLPQSYYDKYNHLEQLMIFRILRPDKFQLLVQQKILMRFGSEFVDSQSFNLETIFKDSKNSTPIIFILSPGSDPLNDIIKLSFVLGKAKNVDVLSLGQGQEEAAQKFLEAAQAKGRWVVLQNCHLAPRILSQIEKCFDESQNAEFRLWLTSMPSDKFPVSLLQTGIKITNEAPRGIKANLSRNFSLFGQKYLEHPKGSEWRKLLFSLTLFHSVIQERRKFGALGWNIPYEFSQTDLVISAAQMFSMMKDFQEIPWKTLHYTISEANYGGRVTDPQDRRLINVILSNFVSPQVFADFFSFSESKNYLCPSDNDMPGYLNYIKEHFPLNDAPEVFGLHQNAEITSGINQTNEFMGSLLNLLPRTSSLEGMTPDQIIQQKCSNILIMIPPIFDFETVQKRFLISYENSMNSVLHQEIFKYNKLSDKVTSSLKQLQKAVDGLVMMSEELDEIYSKMMNNKVPDSWHSCAYPSVKPLMSWVHNLVERLKFIKDWIDNGQPTKYWISGFFFTQSFLTGIMQNFARKTKTPVDSVIFEFVFLEKQSSLSNVPDIGAYIYGLKIEGAQLTENPISLTDSLPKVLFCDVGTIWLKPVVASMKHTGHCYRCPVYKTSKRAGTLSTTGHSTNYVITIDVPMKQSDNEDFWIRRGVAMLCDLDD